MDIVCASTFYDAGCNKCGQAVLAQAAGPRHCAAAALLALQEALQAATPLSLSKRKLPVYLLLPNETEKGGTAKRGTGEICSGRPVAGTG